jgi:hypothetical protein
VVLVWNSRDGAHVHDSLFYVRERLNHQHSPYICKWVSGVAVSAGRFGLVVRDWPKGWEWMQKHSRLRVRVCVCLFGKT